MPVAFDDVSVEQSVRDGYLELAALILAAKLVRLVVFVDFAVA